MSRLLICLFVLLFTVFFFPQLSYAQQASSNCIVTKVGSPEVSVTLPASCNTSSGKSGNFTYYCQMDPAYNDDAMWGGSSCLLEAGCGPTSMAMILSNFGVVMTPNQVDAIFKQNGWRTYCGDASVYGGAVESPWFKNLGFTYSPGMTPGGKPDLSLMKQYLDQGYLIYGGVNNYPCLGCITAGSIAPGHVIVIDDVDIANKRIHVRDPNNCRDDDHSEKTAWSWMSLTEVVSPLPDTSPFTAANATWNEMYAIKKL